MARVHALDFVQATIDGYCMNGLYFPKLFMSTGSDRIGGGLTLFGVYGWVMFIRIRGHTPYAMIYTKANLAKYFTYSS